MISQKKCQRFSLKFAHLQGQNKKARVILLGPSYK
jgi:hypothetical protein